MVQFKAEAAREHVLYKLRSGGTESRSRVGRRTRGHLSFSSKRAVGQEVGSVTLAVTKISTRRDAAKEGWRDGGVLFLQPSRGPTGSCMPLGSEKILELSQWWVLQNTRLRVVHFARDEKMRACNSDINMEEGTRIKSLKSRKRGTSRGKRRGDGG